MNTSTPLKGVYIIKGIQLNRTGNYTLLAQNEEGADSKTVEVTFLGKDSMLFNFIQCRWGILQETTINSSSHKQLCWLPSLSYPLMIQFIRWKMNVKSFRRLAFACFTIVLNTGNLWIKVCKQWRFTKHWKFGFHPQACSQNFLRGGAIQRGDGPGRTY